ncbi:TPA: lipopolysaccharide 1,3-galactosyltransferase, partial [Citrobacter freundii]|nr:lipopolysaccharide 1,3-galactosyltransferase [Citrobacter freundii]
MCLNDNRFILSQIDYNYSGYDETECFNVCYGLDKNFLFGCGVSIASILINNPQEKLAFHVFTDYFSTDFREEFEMLAKKYKTRIFIYLINGDTLKILPSTRSWSYAIYFRFIIADYFSDKLDRIL